VVKKQAKNIKKRHDPCNIDEKLVEQRAILEKILESSPVGIALIENRKFKWVNNEMVQMFGYRTKVDFENKSTRMIYANIDDYNRLGKKINNSFAKSGTADHEIDLVKKDNTRFPVHIRLNSGDLFNPMASTIATFIDISLRRSAQKETYEKERLQGVLEMAGAVCHEINQPLQAILGYSELLQLNSQSDKIQVDNIQSIKSQAIRLGEITKKLSTITHYRTVNYPGNIKIFDIWSSGSDTKY